jgi:arylsulfatase A-like enzyme
MVQSLTFECVFWLILNVSNAPVIKTSRNPLNQQLTTVPPWLTSWMLLIGGIWRKPHIVPSDLAIFVAVWCVFALFEFAVQLFIPRSAIRANDLPPGARVFLFCYSLTVLAFFLLCIGGVTTLLAWTASRFIPDRLGLRRIVGSVVPLSIWLILICYGASWGLFWQTGSFIASQVIAFLAPHPLQVVHWVDLDLALVIIVFSIAGTYTITAWIPRLVAELTLRNRDKLILVGAWAVGLSMMGAFLGGLYSHWGERQFTRAGILYSRTQENRSGPLSYALSDFKKNIVGRAGSLAFDGSFQIYQRSLLSMDQYKSLANQHSHHSWNVLIITVESLRADQLRAYGGTRDVMPAVESLANEARVFLNTYTQSSHTNYATIVPLSSHYPLRSATAHTYPKNPTYPRVLIYDVLKALGRRTALFSSSNENWGGMINYLETGGLDHLVHAANSKKSTYLMQGDAGFAIWARNTKHAGSLDDRSTVDEAIQWLDGIGDQPFFVAMNLQNSHLPYPIPPQFPRRFGPAKLDFTIRFAHFPQTKAQVVKDVYADSLAYVDSQIARLFQYLKDKKKWENTVVVVTGDHGQAFYEHGFASHASAIFNEVMRVPLIVRAPRLKAGLDRRLAQHVDIAPSILGLLGMPVHPSFQGIDLFNTNVDPKRSIYMVVQTPDAHQYGIVRSGFKLVYDEREREHLLFNLAIDPEEKTNIAFVQPALVRELASRLNAWRKLQIDYYADPALQTREYPPILKD